MSGPDFAVSKTGTTQANGRHDVGAAGSVLREPTGPTVPLNRLAPEAALRRLELTVVRRLEGFLQGDHLGLLPGPRLGPQQHQDLRARPGRCAGWIGR